MSFGLLAASLDIWSSFAVSEMIEQTRKTDVCSAKLKGFERAWRTSDGSTNEDTTAAGALDLHSGRTTQAPNGAQTPAKALYSTANPDVCTWLQQPAGAHPRSMLNLRSTPIGTCRAQMPMEAPPPMTLNQQMIM